MCRARRSPVVISGNVVYLRGYGVRETTNESPADAHTRYEVGSITKQFAAVAILQLKETHKINLDAAVARYVDGVPHGREVTIRELLTQTSGIPEYVPGAATRMDARATFAQLMARIAGKPLDFKPGTSWEYSSTNYLILGRIIEAVSGRSWETYARDKLFIPAGMYETGSISQEPHIADMAVGYAIADGRTVRADSISESWAGAAGDIVTTAGDLAKWNNALRSGRIISAVDYRLLKTAYHLPNGSSTGYGFGVFLDSLEGQPRVWHPGNTFGFDGSDEVFPNQQAQIIVLTNSVDGDSGEIAAQVYNDVFPPIAAAKKDAAAEEDPAAKTLYAGRWSACVCTAAIVRTLRDRYGCAGRAD